jgi:alpha-beta hydrolase superfamily lysophospholipase
VSLKDGGLADAYWKQYYTPDEVEEILAHRTTTMFVSGNYPIHVGLYVQSHSAPTVLMAHGLFVYGLSLARLQLPFFRAGFNVVAWDLPGMGQSGGARGGCTVVEFVRAWQDALEFAHRHFGAPLYALGVAEDAISCYHALANSPEVSGLSVHTLVGLGDYESMHWHGPAWWMRMLVAGLRLGSLARPSITRPSVSLVPLEWIFTEPGDERVIELLRHDPISFKRVTLRMASMLGAQIPAPVPYEACHTPVQLIASESNRIWRYDVVVSNYQRLAGPKQLVTLPGAGQWAYNRDFHEQYATHVIRWFNANGGDSSP